MRQFELHECPVHGVRYVLDVNDASLIWTLDKRKVLILVYQRKRKRGASGDFKFGGFHYVSENIRNSVVCRLLLDEKADTLLRVLEDEVVAHRMGYICISGMLIGGE